MEGDRICQNALQGRMIQQSIYSGAFSRFANALSDIQHLQVSIFLRQIRVS